MFDQVALGVYAVENRFVEGKSGIVIGSNRALAIDAGNYADEGQDMADFIRAQGWPPDYLALTHGHGDHILGGECFKQAEIFAHATTTAVIRSQLAAWAQRTDETIAQVEARVIWPTITFTEALCIDLGGKHVRLFHTPGHSQDGVCAYVEEDRVLLGGDTAVTGIVPAIGDGDSVELEATLRMLSKMTIDVLVPGHGAVMRGAERVRDWLAGWARYLASARNTVRVALARGDDPQAVAEMIGYQEFIGDLLPVDKHNMPRRHRNTVQKIIEEELGRRREAQ